MIAMPTFQSTRPRGARLCSLFRDSTKSQFQSTHPARGATSVGFYALDPPCVSIHAPPWGATLFLAADDLPGDVSIHALHARRDKFCMLSCGLSCVSIHAPHARRDNFCILGLSCQYGFNPHTACAARRKRFHGRFLLPHIRGYYLPQICFFSPFCPTALLRYGIPIIFITVFPVHSTFAHIKSYSNKTYSSFSQRFICQTTRKRFPVYRHSSSPARRGCSLPEGSVARRTLYLSLSLSIPSSA